ncbi:MAG: hypothetical protein ACYCXN_15945 [Acidimicrobiales bacterium]|jgi:uncharacterized membrane protein
MIVVLGLIVLVAAIVVGMAGVLSNHGSAHTLHHGFALLGYHVTGTTGTVFLYGVVVGAVAVLGLILLLAGARRTSRRGRAARRGLEHSRSETVAARNDRDDMLGEREAARAETASVLKASSSHGEAGLKPVDGRRRRHRFGHRAVPRQDAASTRPDG